MVGIIGTCNKVRALLHCVRRSCCILDPEKISSLTTYLHEHAYLTDLVITPVAQSAWSQEHIAAAASSLGNHGNIIFWCPDSTPPGNVKSASSAQELLQFLAPVSPKIGMKGHPKREIRTVSPLTIPQGTILLLAVYASQARIGCTTQSIGLWHYVRALGFSPAVVGDAERIKDIAKLMNGKEITDGFLIEGVPMVYSTNLSYDCYILDLGANPKPENLASADIRVLVAGSKPWEMPSTIDALKRSTPPVILSYTTLDMAVELHPVIPNSIPAVYTPIPWECHAKAMLLYDSLLRVEIKKALERGLEYDIP